MAMTTVPLGASLANPRCAPIVPAGPNSLATAATRRGLLGAIAAAPLLALPMGHASASGAEWHAALSDWQRIRETWNGIADAFCAAEQRYWRDDNPRTSEAYDRLDALSTEWMHKDDDALRRIVATPAPNIEAVIHKLEIAEENDLHAVQAAIADLRRLAGSSAA